MGISRLDHQPHGQASWELRNSCSLRPQRERREQGWWTRRSSGPSVVSSSGWVTWTSPKQPELTVPTEVLCNWRGSALWYLSSKQSSSSSMLISFSFFYSRVLLVLVLVIFSSSSSSLPLHPPFSSFLKKCLFICLFIGYTKSLLLGAGFL